MKQTMMVAAVTVLALGAAACTDSERARRSATFTDQPADIVCWTYGTESFRGRSTGKIEYEGGYVSFVDASNGRYTTLDGDCRVTYLNEGDAEAVPPVEPVAPVKPVAALPPVPAE